MRANIYRRRGRYITHVKDHNGNLRAPMPSKRQFQSPALMSQQLQKKQTGAAGAGTASITETEPQSDERPIVPDEGFRTVWFSNAPLCDTEASGVDVAAIAVKSESVANADEEETRMLVENTSDSSAPSPPSCQRPSTLCPNSNGGGGGSAAAGGGTIQELTKSLTNKERIEVGFASPSSSRSSPNRNDGGGGGVATGGGAIKDLTRSPSNKEKFQATLYVQSVGCCLDGCSAGPAVRLTFKGTIVVLYPLSFNPERRYVVFMDEHGSTGITIWNSNLKKIASNCIGKECEITKVNVTTHQGKRVINLCKESEVTQHFTFYSN